MENDGFERIDIFLNIKLLLFLKYFYTYLIFKKPTRTSTQQTYKIIE